ncbi:hypothetical protein V1478_017470 [Vespula squamosa]|uniref:Uncharacterized protein n=1 Tax=Vespula squamosa TaxID=30214 RepID=A0ABD1ZWX8_VESSQ
MGATTSAKMYQEGTLGDNSMKNFSQKVLGGLGRRMSSGDKVQTGLTIDRAAFLLLRVKKAFKKKKQQRKEKSSSIIDSFISKS